MPSRRSGSLNAWLASDASTGSPASRAVTPGGGFSRERMSASTACCASSDSSRMPNASTAVVRSRVITACDTYGGIAFSSARICVADDADCGVVNRSDSDSAGCSCVPARLSTAAS